MSGLAWHRPELWPLLLLLPACFAALLWVFRAGARRSAIYGAAFTERACAPLARALRWTAALGFLLLAWMEPLLGEEKVTVERRGLDVIFCLDTSRSMLARDIEPNRLARAKRDIETVLPDLIGGDRVGLVVFAGKARLVVPLTHDLDSFRQLLAPVDTDTALLGGTDLAAAIRKALAVADPQQAATTVIVLLTDGEDLTGAGRQAAREASAQGVVVHAVGYGSTLGSKVILEEGGGEKFLADNKGEEVVSALDADGLRALAESAGGEFVRADVMPLPLIELKRKRIDPMVARAYEAGEETLRKTRFQWVLLPGVVLLILELLLVGGRRR
jgi:Ca-activated chloride channel family protein